MNRPPMMMPPMMMPPMMMGSFNRNGMGPSPMMLSMMHPMFAQNSQGGMFQNQLSDSSEYDYDYTDAQTTASPLAALIQSLLASRAAQSDPSGSVEIALNAPADSAETPQISAPVEISPVDPRPNKQMVGQDQISYRSAP